MSPQTTHVYTKELIRDRLAEIRSILKDSASVIEGLPPEACQRIDTLLGSALEISE